MGVLDLRKVPTRDLEKELRRRTAIRDSRVGNRVYCDTCKHLQVQHRTWTGAEYERQRKDGYRCLCALRHMLMFQVPADYGDINARTWGFYRPGKCPDYSPAREPENLTVEEG